MKPVFIIAIVAIAMIGVMVPSVFAETNFWYSNVSNEIITEKTIDVNLILIGDEWSPQQPEQILKNLILEYEPIVFDNDKIGIHYNYNYNFLSASENDSDKLFAYMTKNSIAGVEGDDMLLHHYVWVEKYHPNWWDNDDLLSIPYESYDVLDIEKYLYDEIIKNDSNLNSKNSVNLIFLKGDLSKLNSVHDYTLNSRDVTSNEPFHAFGLTGYGGNYNLYFFDLYAAPWMDFDWDNYYNTDDVLGSWFIPDLMFNLHDCPDDSCFTDIVQEQINSAMQYIITPSTVYPVNYKNNYLIDVVVYSMPGSSMITSGTVGKFIDMKKITNELESLIPFSTVTVQLSIETVKTRGMSNDFKNSITSADRTVQYNPWDDTETNFTFLRSEQIKPHLLEWAQERQSLNDKKFDWVIPVLISIDTRPGSTYVDNWGVTGFAPAMDWDDESLQPCCAFGVLDSDDVWKNKLGGTDLVLHEVGHTLGLAHTFQSIAPDSIDISKNTFWNQYESPMTYAGPPSGCGYVFSLVYSNLCGIADASFTEFEKKHMANMIFTSLVKNTKDNLIKYKESEFYDFKKYNKINSEINEFIDKFQKINILDKYSPIKDIQQSYIQSQILLDEIPDEILETTEKESAFGSIFLSHDSMTFSNYDTQYLKIFGDVNKELDGSRVTVSIKYPNGKIHDSRLVLDSNNKFETLFKIDRETKIGIYEISAKFSDEISNIKIFTITEFEEKTENIPIPTVQSSENISKIPTWVKTNAGWWSDGLIDENTFITGIEFLIDEKIIHVESISQKSEKPEEVPTWIKNNAGWWADGTIDDNSFVQGIEFLVKQGIIRVN